MIEITPIGCLVIPISIYLFLKRKNTELLYFFTFFTPFSAATILLIKGSKFGLPPAFFIGALFIASTCLKVCSKAKLSMTKTQRHYLLLMLVFWLIALTSLSYPFVLSFFKINYTLFNPLLQDQNQLWDFQTYTLSQFVYFTLFNLMAIAVMLEADTLKKVAMSIKFFCISAFVTALWGILIQYSSFYMKYDYPDWLFNNHPGYSQGFDQNFIIIPRICSVAQEPSVYGYFLTTVIALLLMLTIKKHYILNYRFQKMLTMLLIFTAIVTTSSTAYLGLLIILSLILSHYFDFKSILKLRINMCQIKIVFFVALIVLLVASIVFSTINFLGFDAEEMLNVVANLTTSKLATGSGAERTDTFMAGIQTFLDTYLFGTGYGSNRNFELGSTLLANVGLPGFAVFILMVGYMIKKTLYVYSSSKQNHTALAIIALSLYLSFLSSLVLMFISIPDFVNTYYWLIFGLLLSLPKIASSSSQPLALKSI